MSQHAINTPVPSLPRWRRQSLAGIALVALLAAGAGAAGGALLASDSSVTYRPTPVPAPALTPPDPAEPWDGNALLAVVTAVPGAEARVGSLSAPVRQMISDAVQAAAWGPYVPVMPDTDTLYGLLGRLTPADRQVILSLLPPGTAELATPS